MTHDKNTVNILFFARLREQLPQPTLELPWSSAQTAETLRQTIVAQGEDWSALTADHLIAINQDMARPEHWVKPGDEVAFFPPVTGG